MPELYRRKTFRWTGTAKERVNTTLYIYTHTYTHRESNSKASLLVSLGGFPYNSVFWAPYCITVSITHSAIKELESLVANKDILKANVCSFSFMPIQIFFYISVKLLSFFFLWVYSKEASETVHEKICTFFKENEEPCLASYQSKWYLHMDIVLIDALSK